MWPEQRTSDQSRARFAVSLAGRSCLALHGCVALLATPAGDIVDLASGRPYTWFTD